MRKPVVTGTMPIGSLCVPAFLAVVLAAVCLAPLARAADDKPDDLAAQAKALYTAVTVVTGKGEQNRGPGLAQCLRDVLVKTTGDPAILDDPRLANALVSPASLIRNFSYRDLLEGKPVHDEQGTYDRPHFLTVEFDPAAIDALARDLGRAPWPPPRPQLMAFVAVEGLRARFMLSRDGAADRSADMRSALAAAAQKVGLTIALPAHAELEARGWSANTLPDAAASDLAAVAQGGLPLTGRMVFREAALGWIVEWRLAHGGKMFTWGARGINFDGAFRNALTGAAQILSGHGQPR